MLTLTPDVEAGLRRLQLATTPEDEDVAFRDLAETLTLHDHGIAVSLFKAGFRVGHAASRREAEEEAASQYNPGVGQNEEPKPATTREELAADVNQRIGGPITVNADGVGSRTNITAPTTTTTTTNVGIGGLAVAGIVTAVGGLLYLFSSSTTNLTPVEAKPAAPERCEGSRELWERNILYARSLAREADRAEQAARVPCVQDFPGMARNTFLLEVPEGQRASAQLRIVRGLVEQEVTSKGCVTVTPQLIHEIRTLVDEVAFCAGEPP